jgi:hypothetical protein
MDLLVLLIIVLIILSVAGAAFVSPLVLVLLIVALLLFVGPLPRSAGAPLGAQARRRQPAFADPTTARTPGTGSVQPLSAAKRCACRPYPRLGQRGGLWGCWLAGW